MRRQAERQLRRLGYAVVGSGERFTPSNYRLHRIGPPPPGFEHLRTDPRSRFTVDLDQITSPIGFSYHPDGWHPYRATIDEYRADPELPYERSTLCAYYRSFQPTSVQEALLEHIADPLEPLSAWPPLLRLFKHVWALNRRQVDNILAHPNREKGPRQQFGPQPDADGRRHMQRLLAAYESLQDHGYQPDAFPDGLVTGYFLVRGDRYRFVVFQGNHRLAGLRHLGISQVQAGFHPGHPPVVREEDLERWTGRGGLFRPEVAWQLFDKLFTERGDTKARNLGLLPRGAD